MADSRITDLLPSTPSQTLPSSIHTIDRYWWFNYRFLLIFKVVGFFACQHLVNRHPHDFFLNYRHTLDLDLDSALIESHSQRKILGRVRKTKYFCVLSDVSRQEQCVGNQEDFITSVGVTDVTGKGLVRILKSTLLSIDFTMNYLRGQGCDGATAIRGTFRDVSTNYYFCRISKCFR